MISQTTPVMRYNTPHVLSQESKIYKMPAVVRKRGTIAVRETVILIRVYHQHSSRPTHEEQVNARFAFNIDPGESPQLNPSED